MPNTDSMEDRPVVESRRRTTWQKGQSGNPAGRSPRVERLRQLLDPYQDRLVMKAIKMALAGDMMAMRLVLERIAPPPKPESAPVSIPGIALAKTMADKARAIVDAVGGGAISPDAGATLLGAIANASRIVESEEHARQIAELEAMVAALQKEMGHES